MVFKKNRNISNNIRLTFDVIDYVNHRNIPGAILSLDIQKAFDSIDWLFVKGMLERYQFGVNLIKWVKILFTRPQTRHHGGHTGAVPPQLTACAPPN